MFRLGPFWFLTVRQVNIFTFGFYFCHHQAFPCFPPQGQLAGAYRKKGGQFQIFPPGFSYQLSDEEFEACSSGSVVLNISSCKPCFPATSSRAQKQTRRALRANHFHHVRDWDIGGSVPNQVCLPPLAVTCSSQ